MPTSEDKGVPLAEMFTRAERNRLGFFRWFFRQRPEIRFPTQSLPPPNPPNVTGVGEFFARRAQRGKK